MSLKTETAVIRWVAAVAALTALSLGPTLPANAHAQLLNSNPAVSATLAKQPKLVALTFDDDLVDLNGGNQIMVTNSANKHVELGATKLSGATLSVALKAGLTTGKYQVVYKALSADGHPVTGTYFFYLKLAKKK